MKPCTQISYLCQAVRFETPLVHRLRHAATVLAHSILSQASFILSFAGLRGLRLRAFLPGDCDLLFRLAVAGAAEDATVAVKGASSLKFATVLERSARKKKAATNNNHPYLGTETVVCRKPKCSCAARRA